MSKNLLRRLGALACVAFTCSAMGSQTVKQADLEACHGLPGDDMKLACYRSLTLRGRTDSTLPSAAVAPRVEPAGPIVEQDLGSDEPAPAAPPRIDDRFGKQHLDSDNGGDEPERFSGTATIVKVEKRSHGTLFFYMDNGQIWRQMEPRFFPYPKNRTFQVELDHGMMGDYRLQVEGKGQKTRIRRVK
jgi:hypothetical protein